MYNIGEFVKITGSSRYGNGPRQGIGVIISVHHRFDSIIPFYDVCLLGKDPTMDWFSYHIDNIKTPDRIKKMKRILNGR